MEIHENREFKNLPDFSGFSNHVPVNKILNTKSKISLAALFIGCAAVIQAQDQASGWNWPGEIRKTAEEKYALYTSWFVRGNYKAAVPPLTWLLANAPGLNPSLYINGARIYDNLFDNETDPARKKIDADSCLMLFDQRIRFFGDEAGVLNRKALYAYKFKADDKGYYKELYDLFKISFELNKTNFLDNNIVPYLDVIRRYRLGGGNIRDEEMLYRFDTLLEVLDYKIRRGKNVALLISSRDQAFNLLPATVDVSCEYIDQVLLPKLDANPSDLKLAKDIFKLAFEKCSAGAAFLQAAKTVQEYEPTYGMARLIGDRYADTGNLKNAMDYYSNAIGLTDDNIRIAELYLKQAVLGKQSSNKSEARDLAKKCLAADPSNLACYNLIGDLYFSSYDECRQDVNPVNDRAVYIAAYEMYSEAGNREGMTRAEEQFPLKEEIIKNKMKPGQPVKIGCWINETVILQKRE